jgi:hypothetical protein
VLLLAGLAALYFKLQNEQSPTALTSTSPTQPISTATPLVALSPDAAVEPMPSPSQPADSAPVETAPSSATAMQPATRSIDQQLFTFALTGCRLAGTIATCDLVITNRDRDRRLALDRFNTLLFDEAGGSYKSLRAQFPNQEGETRLVSGIPTKVQVVFEGLPTQTRKIALLEIAFTGDSYDKVGFRNIVLSNSNAPNSSNLPATLKASQSLDAQLITFALTECRLAGTIVTCALALTNRDRDKRFSLDRFNTKITDETGNVYSCRQTRVANQETEVRLITDVPAGARLVFEGIAPQARKLSKLEIAFTADSYDKTEFRNIPLISGQRN